MNASLFFITLSVHVFLFFFSYQAIFKLIPKDEVPDLPDDENTAEKRADKLWNYFEKGENGEIQ